MPMFRATRTLSQDVNTLSFPSPCPRRANSRRARGLRSCHSRCPSAFFRICSLDQATTPPTCLGQQYVTLTFHADSLRVARACCPPFAQSCKYCPNGFRCADCLHPAHSRSRAVQQPDGACRKPRLVVSEEPNLGRLLASRQGASRLDAFLALLCVSRQELPTPTSSFSKLSVRATACMC